MSKAAMSVLVFGIYLVILGAIWTGLALRFSWEGV